MNNLMVLLMFVICFWCGWNIKRIIDEPEEHRLSPLDIYEERKREPGQE